ncbi:MAG: shikimate dehydrogenase family protein [Gemmatimonadales bacterium]
MIDGATRVFAILGNPVAHSLSPTMHNAVFRTLGLPAVYVPLLCPAEEVPTLIRALGKAGGGGNVTIPHKEIAARAVDVSSDLVETVEACNTFWSDDGATAGDNTDVVGVLKALRELDAPRAPWLIAGTGGGARAAVVAARECGVGVAVTSRDAGRRSRFESWVCSRGVELVGAEECRVLINSTPLGLRKGDPLPIQPEVAPHAQVALDMVYVRGETEWVRAMRSRVRRAADGRGMLVAQGAAAFELWFPQERAPTEVMRAAVNAALR